MMPRPLGWLTWRCVLGYDAKDQTMRPDRPCLMRVKLTVQWAAVWQEQIESGADARAPAKVMAALTPGR
jgi:hypothetical protein